MMNDDLNRMTGMNRGSGGTGGWAAIDWEALTHSLLPAPELTDAMLPAGWGKWITDTAADTSAPKGYTALNLIITGAGAIGNSRGVYATAGWSQPAVLWGASVGPPSSRKTTSQNPFRRVIGSVEYDLYKKWKRAKADLEKDAQEATKGKQKAFKPPPMERWTLNDATIEKLAEISAENPRGLLLFVDELAAWFGSFGRYGASDLADRGFYLAAYDANTYTRDRIKNPEPIYIPKLGLSIIGAMVSARLNQILENGVNDGLISRFLFDWSDPPPIAPLSRRIDPGIGERRKTLQEALTRLRGLELASDVSWDVILDPDAFAAFDKERMTIEEMARKQVGTYAEWLGKAGGRILRLALVYEFLAWAIEPPVSTLIFGEGRLPEPTGISLDTMNRAIEYTKYQRAMFRRVMTSVEPSKVYEDGAELVKALREKGLKTFGVTGDIGQLPGFRYFRGIKPADRERRDGVLALLEDYGVIRAMTMASKRGPVTKYAVNPALEERN